MVALYVYEPSNVELSAPETVRLDRLAYSHPGGWTTEQHGDLLRPGSTALRLTPGVYHFRTVNDAQLTLAHGSSVHVVTTQSNDKDDWPRPTTSLLAPVGTAGQALAEWASHTSALFAKGFGSTDRVPTLTVVHDNEVQW